MAVLNYGHFTSMQVRNGRVSGFGLHLDRLVASSQALFGHPVDPDRVRNLIRHALAGQKSASVRINVFARETSPGEPEPHTPAVMVSVSDPVGPHPDRPWHVCSAVYQRDLPAHKHVATMGLIHHRRLARAQGFDDVLFCDADSAIIEGSTWNITFWDGHHVIVPEAPALPGITLQLLQRGLSTTGVPTSTRRVDLAELPSMLAAAATSSLNHRQQITSIDHTVFTDQQQLHHLLHDAWATIPAEHI